MVSAGVADTHLTHHPVGKAEFAVGTRPNAEIVPKLPVIEVVFAAVYQEDERVPRT